MSIEERLARLEKGSRFWRRLAFLLLLLVFAFVASQSVEFIRPPELEARSLAILDADGRVRMRLGCDPDGEMEQKFFDAAGSLRLNLSEGLGGAYLDLSDATHKNSFLAHAGGGEVNLFMQDARNAIRLGARVTREGSPQVRIYDAEGDLIWQAPQ